MALIYRRKGGAILVNTETSGSQSAPNMAVLPGGGYVVVWTDASMSATSSVTDIKAQRFDADGVKVGAEFLVNTTVTAAQGSATIATLPSGRFVVTWSDLSATANPGSILSDVRGQMFEADGTRVGGEFLINTQNHNNQQFSVIAELAGGGFVVSWTDSSAIGGDTSGSGIKAQLFDAAGAKVGGEILVNTETLGGQSGPTITALASGGFAVAWRGTASGSGGLTFGSIRYQLYDAAGAPVGTEQSASTITAGTFMEASIAALGTGFVVVYAHSASPADGAAFEIRAQLFDAAGGKVGSEFLVNTSSAGDQRTPDVDALPGGGFIVTWRGANSAGTGNDVYAQVFDAAGVKVGVEFMLTSSAAGDQFTPKVEVLPSGDVVLTWSDNSGAGGDSSSFGVISHILTLATDAPTDIALSSETVSETAMGNSIFATLSATGAINSSFTYEIVSDSSGGAFAIDDGRLIVSDNRRLDFETASSIDLRIRATDLNGLSYEETVAIAVTDVALEARFSAGEEFIVQTSPSTGLQMPHAPRIAVLEGGGSVVIWAAADSGIDFQIYDAEGDPVGGEGQVTASSFSNHFDAAVPLASGGFAVFWQDPSGGSHIRGQIFDSAGTKLGGAFETTTGGHDPDSAALEGGAMVVTWTDDNDVRAQIFNSAGVKLGGEIVVAAATPGLLVPAPVAALPGGGFVVSWRDEDGVWAQRFDAGGAPVGAAIEVVDGVPGIQNSNLASLASGGFIVTWNELVDEGEPTEHDELKAQLVDADGVKLGDPMLIDVLIPESASPAIVQALPDGGFVISWNGTSVFNAGDGDHNAIFAQLYTASGALVSDPIVVNDVPGDVRVAVRDNGDLLFSWAEFFLEGTTLKADIKARTFTRVPGTEGPDTLDGTPGDDVIHGLGGDDLINGLGGRDQLFGEEGDDQLHGGEGMDELFGAAGNDRLEGGAAFDWLQGGAGNDLLYGGADGDRLEDSSGDDQLYGEGGNDSLSVFHDEGAPAGIVLMDGGEGDDIVSFFTTHFFDDATLIGGGGDDRISTYRGQNVTIDAGSGNDQVFLNVLGADYTITLGTGADMLSLPRRFEAITREGQIVVTDFETGELGDRLELLFELTSVLQGWSSDSNPFATQHLRLIQNGADAVLQIDEDGTAGIHGFADLVRFQNRDVAAFTQHNLSGYPADGGPPIRTHFVGTAARDVLWGSFGDDLMQGLAGPDEIYGGAGDDQIEGGDAADLLDGQLGSDVLLGGSGDDQLFDDLGGDDALYGEAGADRIRVIRNEPSAVSHVLMDGGADNDDLTYTAHFEYGGTATLAGGAGDDRLYAFGGRSVTFDGGTGNDHVEIVLAEGPYTVTLGAGSDQFRINGVLRNMGELPPLSITITDFAPGAAGPSTDVLVLRDYLTTVLVDWDGTGNAFESGHLQLVRAGPDAIIRIDRDGFAGPQGAADLIRFQNVTPTALTAYNLDGFDSGTFDRVGTAGADNLQGSWGQNFLSGLGGDDTLFGFEGDDRIDGGAGADGVLGGGGADLVTGGAGGDFLFGDDGGDTLLGEDGDDHIEGGAGQDGILGGIGNDRIYGGEDEDYLFGEDGEDLIRGGNGGDYANGGAGNDDIAGEAGNDTIEGGAGIDVVSGGIGEDQLFGGADNDALYGEDGGDSLSGNEGDDYLEGGAGRDGLIGGAGIDILAGGSDGDWLFGDEGGDTLLGQEGDDHIEGGAGQDGILGGIGNDRLYGGEDADFMFGEDGEDLIRGGNGGDYAAGGAGNDDIAGEAGNDTIEAGAGIDIVLGGIGDDQLFGGADNDSLYGEDGGDSLSGNEGDDYLEGGAGRDGLIGGAGIDTLAGGADGDWLFGEDGGDNIQGQDGDDWLEGGAGQDGLIGGAGNDQLFGGADGDWLFGGDGHDVVNGGDGADYMEGGAGFDLFAFTSALGGGNVDHIADFQIGIDKVALDDAVFAGLAPGALPAGAFVIGSSAQDANDRIVYNQATGALYFDADGNGAGAAVQFASLASAPAISAADFTVI